jgi:hypothetical protein
MMEDYTGTFSLERTCGSDTKASRPISFAKSPIEMQEVGRLRYSRYVERDKKAYHCVDHENKWFLETVDYKSLNLFISSETCLTAARITKARFALKDEFLARLLQNTPIDPSKYDRLVVVSRLVSADRPEARLLVPTIVQECYRVSLVSGIRFATIATRRALVPFFTKLGFVECGKHYTESVAGEMNVLTMDLWDRNILSRTGSIFLPVFEAYQAHQLAEAVS